MFASYAAELEALAEALEDGLRAAESEDGDVRERRTALQRCEVDLGQAEGLVRQMNVEARSEPGAGLKRQLAAHRDRVKGLAERLQAARQRSDRQDLFDARAGGASSASGQIQLSSAARDDRRRFEQATARLDSSTEALLDSRRTLAETEDVAIGITENLAANRSLIINAHERVTTTNGLVEGAGRILRRMRQRETRRKMMLAGLVALLLFVIVLIFYFSFASGGGGTTSP